jgi:acetoin utilization protein AcuB
MTKNPVTVAPRDTLAAAQKKMEAGHFRRVLVVQDGALVGILTDRDLRRHVGAEDRTRVEAAMTETPLTVSPLTTVEEATQLMLKHQFSGLPVVEDGKPVGIITTSDILRAFLDMIGASTEDSIRIDLQQPEGGGDLSEAARLVNELGGEVLGVGTTHVPWEGQRVFYVRMRGADPEKITTGLEKKGYTIVGVH